MTLNVTNLCGFGAGGAIDSWSIYFGRTTGMESTTQDDIQTLINGLKADDSWNALDSLHVAGEATTSTTDAFDNMLQNIKQNAYNASRIGTPSFSYNSGFAVTSGNAVDSNFNALSGANFNTASNSLGVYITTDDGVGDFIHIGWVDYDTGADLYNQRAGNAEQLRARNENTSDISPELESLPTKATGFFGVTRQGAADLRFIHNYSGGSSTQDSTPSISTALSQPMSFSAGVGCAATGASSYSDYAHAPARIGAWFFGGGLTDAQLLSIATRLQTYFTSRGTEA